MQAKGRVAKFRGGHPWNTNVDCHGLHVQAVLRHAVTVKAEIFITPRGAIAADNLDLGVRAAECRSQVMQKIEYARIVVVNIAGTVIAQVPIKALERIGVVCLPVPVDDVEPFPGVGVKEMKAIRSLR